MCDLCKEIAKFKIYSYPLFPKVMLVPEKVWTAVPRDDDEEDFLWFLDQAGGCLAFYYPCANTVFVRNDAFTWRVLLHELGHWIIYKWLHDAWNLQDWWDSHSPFLWHLVSTAVKCGIMSRKEVYDAIHQRRKK